MINHTDDPRELDITDPGPIDVRYRCNACGLDSCVSMPPRRRQVHINLWLELLTRRVTEAHHISSGVCGNDSVDLMFPDYTKTGSTGVHIMDVPWPLNPDGEQDDGPAN